MRLTPPRALLSVSLLALPALLSSCDFANGLSDVGSTLGSPGAALIDAPGRQLAEGRFRKVTVDGTLKDGGKIIALQEQAEGNRLVVLPYPDGDNCEIDPAVNFDRLSSRLSVELPGLFAVQTSEDENGRGEIQLLDFECKQAYPSLQNARLPRVLFPSVNPKGVLNIDGEGTLFMITPGKENLIAIDEEISLARTSQDYIFARKGDQIVVYDDSLEAIDKFGDGVIDFLPNQGSRLSLAFYDQNGLSVWNEKDGVTLVSSSGCSATFWGNEALAFFDPCDDRRLQVYALRSQVSLTGDDFITLDGPSGVANLDLRSLSWGSTPKAVELSFLLGEAGASQGQLVFATLPSDIEDESGDHLSLEIQKLGGDDTGFLGSEIITNYSAGLGDLTEIKRDEDDRPESLSPLAAKVARLFGGRVYSPQGILANFDGQVGDLLWLTQERGGEAKTTTLLSKVPNQALTVEAETARWAVVADSEDGKVGALYLSATDEAPLKRVAEDVWTNTARFLEEPRGLAYLSGPPNEPSAALKVYLIESGLTVAIHKRVNEYRALPWPSPGILYAVPEGDDQGLWYAKAR